MASKSGIAMLSMYGDEDDDMEDPDEEEEVQQDEDMDQNIEGGFIPSNITPPETEEDDSTRKADKNASLKSPEAQINISTRTVHGRRTLVDHGHGEVTMSPEAEDGEVMRAEPDFQTGFDSLQVSTQTTFQSSVHVETSQTVTMHITVRGSDTVEVVDDHIVSGVVSKDVDPLDEFLPSPPEERCSDELQDRINKFLALKRAGKSFNAEVRNKKAYRNPDFLLHAVRYQDIDQIGSCFSKDVFDPHGYDKSDYYDEIEADMKREAERKEQERKKSPKVEFHTGGTHFGTVPTAQKIGLSAPGVSTGGAGGLPLVPVAVDAATRDVRQNKKSKWDKVDGDRINSFPSRGQDPISNVGVHAAISSASNAGAGYTAFAQQRRREAEDKKSSERRRS